MVSQGLEGMPAASNSLIPAGRAAELAFTWSFIGPSAILTQKTRVSAIWATLSLVPLRSALDEVEANMICGGT